MTPIDHGDVCLNVDRKWFASHGVAPPRTLADLTEPRYRNLLVVENPATSTPGLAFMLATIAKFGESGWQDYWRRLRANGVLAVDGWEEAYTARFSGAGGSKGKRPIVVSYATSPAAEVIFAKTPPTTAPTAVVADSCFRQIELAGVLDGARNEKGARAFIDFMLAEQFQASMPESMFVLPVRDGTPLLGCVPQVRRLAAESARAARGRDRQQPRPLDRRVDTGRPALRRGAQLATIAVPAAFLALFFAFPLAAILERGLTSAGGLSLPAGTAGLVWFTVWQAAASTVLTLAAGLPLAWAIGRFRFRGRALARALVLVPFVLPTVVVATAFLAVLPDGYERGLWAILAAHVFFNVAVVTRIVGGAWAAIDPRSAEAAAVLGAGPLRRAREITLPQLAPAISAASALTFLFCFTSFGVILILGGPSRATVETEIYNRAARLFDLQAAAALALLQLGAVAVVLTVAGILEARAGGAATLADENDVLRRPRGWERVAVVGVLGAGALALLFPLAVLVERSRGSWGALFETTPALLVEPWEAAVFSVAFASVAAAIALAVGGLAAVALARRAAGVVDGFVLLPLGASAVMLGFGFLIAFDEAPLDFRSSWWLVPVAQSLIAAPFVVRIVTPALRSIDPALREVAATLGASPLRSRREIDVPLVGRAFAVAAGFAFAIALGEFGATVFVARAEQPTLPVAIFRFLGRPGRGEPGCRCGAGRRPRGDRCGRRLARRASGGRPGTSALMAPALQVAGARVVLGGHEALAGVDLAVERR